MFAREEDFQDILKLFRKHRTIFPHLRPKELEKSITKRQMIWKNEVSIQFKYYQKKTNKSGFICERSDINLMKMVSGKGFGDEVFKLWLDYLGYGKINGRIVLTVRQDNQRAFDFYEKQNFKDVSNCKWKDIDGYVMLMNF
tara:strand:- start:476 stop:898 length:423 start_codon:yes stop_codon:yes gene_type:complete